MPDLGEQIARDEFDEAMRRLGAVETWVRERSGRTLSTWDRGDKDNVPAPVEGQTIIDRAEKPWYYSNGAWRPFGSDAIYPMGPFPIVIPTTDYIGAHDESGFSATSPLLASTDTQLGTWKLQATANGSYLIGAFLLGPYGSRWSLVFDAETGPDCGIFKVDWATGSQDAPNEGFAVPEGMLDSPYNSSGGSYSQFVEFATQDLYAGAPGLANTAYLGDFRIKGADGATLTTATGNDPDLGAGVVPANGGAGVWWIRIRVDGKNGSSSAFRVSFRGIPLVVRHAWDGFVT